MKTIILNVSKENITINESTLKINLINVAKKNGIAVLKSERALFFKATGDNVEDRSDIMKTELLKCNAKILDIMQFEKEDSPKELVEAVEEVPAIAGEIDEEEAGPREHSMNIEK